MERAKRKLVAKPVNPLGKMSPWAWAIEIVRGCNLRCGHCAVRIFPEEERAGRPMTEEVWRALWEVIADVTPARRTELSNAGEPTLHPRLCEFITIAREISPHSQIQVTTNGVRLAKGQITYRDLFNAGVNIVYTDMYAPRELHQRLAEESGIPWYFYHNKPKDAPGAWTYTGPEVQQIALMEHPGQWPEKRRRLGRLGTFLNNLEWSAAEKFGLRPVTVPLRRGCTQPFRYVSIHVDGYYEVCCQDFMGETAGKLGNVLDGPEGFYRFWFGHMHQQHRGWLRDKNRAASPYCSRCGINFSRSDFKMWNRNQFRIWWDGERWQPLDPDDTEVIAIIKAFGEKGGAEQAGFFGLLDALAQLPEKPPRSGLLSLVPQEKPER